MAADYDTCTATKNGFTCIKFAGHPGRCRFARVYRERINPAPLTGDVVGATIAPNARNVTPKGAE